MRISDWSSDVCSSDLLPERTARGQRRPVVCAFPCRRLHLHAQHPCRHLRRAASMQGLLMTAPIAAAISILFWIGVLGLAVGMGRRVALWRAGRAAPVNWLGLLAIPTRYFIDLPHVVAHDPYIARDRKSTRLNSSH